MLLELTIRNFAVIQDTRIVFAPGLNALTGETGAGKSIVVDALSAVLGARTSAEVVRSGTSGAYVEAVFDLDGIADPTPVLERLRAMGIQHDRAEPLVLARDISERGRSTARIANRTTTAAALAEIGSMLVDIHGQSDHVSLLHPAVQLDLLDRYAGTLTLRARVASAFQEWQALQRRIAEFDERQRTRAQRVDLLRFQVDELMAAGLDAGEDARLHHERTVLANAERLAHAAADAQAALAGAAASASDAPGALDLLRGAARILTDIVTLDPVTEPLLTRMNDALFALEDVAAELRDYAERTALDPRRLEQVEDRLDLLRRLTRKYGPSLDDVIAYREQARAELEQIIGDDQDIEALRAEEQRTQLVLASCAQRLSDARRAAIMDLARQVERAIEELNMGRATFEVRFESRPDPAGITLATGEMAAVDATGIDHVTFYLSANAGEEPRPLARVASGGETARLMLALKSILSAADETPVLVFDEVDVGVGGRSGQVVGEKLWGLTDRHQAIVISHLPQVAAFADRHLTLVKRVVDKRTLTSAHVIEGTERLDELAAMLDGVPPTPESRANAVALLHRVDAWKEEHRHKGTNRH